jgi:hypothetical protein
VGGFPVTELSEVDSRTRFLVKVSANSLHIASREWRLGPATEEWHDARLALLGHETAAGLALAIRAGELDHRYAEVVGAVRQTVADKLLVAKPVLLRPRSVRWLCRGRPGARALRARGS